MKSAKARAEAERQRELAGAGAGKPTPPNSNASTAGAVETRPMRKDRDVERERERERVAIYENGHAGANLGDKRRPPRGESPVSPRPHKRSRPSHIEPPSKSAPARGGRGRGAPDPLHDASYLLSLPIPPARNRDALTEHYWACYTNYLALYSRLIAERQRFVRLAKESDAGGGELEEGEEEDESSGDDGRSVGSGGGVEGVMRLKEMHDEMRARFTVLKGMLGAEESG